MEMKIINADPKCSTNGMGFQTVMGQVEHLYRITPLEVIDREVIPAVANL